MPRVFYAYYFYPLFACAVGKARGMDSLKTGNTVDCTADLRLQTNDVEDRLVSCRERRQADCEFLAISRQTLTGDSTGT